MPSLHRAAVGVPNMPRVSVGTGVQDFRRPVRGATHPRASLLTSSTALAVIGLTVLAAFLRFWRLGHQGFWFDEGNTALLVQLSPGKMLGLIPKTESTPPLYYCVAWVWARLFGHSEVPLRSLSALSGVAIVPVAYAAGAKLISRRAGPDRVRAHGMQSAADLVLAGSSFLRAARAPLEPCAGGLRLRSGHPTPRRLAVWVIVSALALATHYYSALAVAPQAAWLLRGGYRRPGVRLAVGIVAVCGLALIPLALSQSHRGLTSWIAHAPLGARIAEVWPQFALGFGSPAWQVLKWVALAAAVVGLVLLAVRPDGRARRGALLAGGLALAGLVLNLLLVAGGIDDLITRNLLAIWMPVMLAVAGGLAAPRTQWLSGSPRRGPVRDGHRGRGRRRHQSQPGAPRLACRGPDAG